MKRLVAVFLVCAAGLVVARSNGQDKPGRIGQAPFMRQKLKFSQNVLEGLALENYPQIAVNAKAMNLLSHAAGWQILPGIDYVRYSTEFQRLTSKLTKAANEKNIDSATLAYVQLTINCVNCHQHVRKQRPPTKKPGRD